MSRRDDETPLRHMLEHAREAVHMMSGRSRADLHNQRMLQLAVVRLFEIVGEAANRVSQERQSRHPEIPWPEIISLRNRIIHGYDRVDLDIVWQIVQDDLPPLICRLDAILSE